MDRIAVVDEVVAGSDRRLADAHASLRIAAGAREVRRHRGPSLHVLDLRRVQEEYAPDVPREIRLASERIGTHRLMLCEALFLLVGRHCRRIEAQRVAVRRQFLDGQ